MAHLGYDLRVSATLYFLALLTIVVIGLLSLFIEGFFFCQSDYCAHNVIALVTSDEGSKNSGIICRRAEQTSKNKTRNFRFGPMR